jgi:hypothetical protein
MTLQMKRKAYLLVFLTFWSQFDDALLTVASAFQSAPLQSNDDDDECLPLKRLAEQEQFAPRRQPQAVSVKPQAAEFSFAGRCVSFERQLITRFPALLYIFMSLQI